MEIRPTTYVVGSSRNITGGLLTSSRAIDNLFCSPPDRNWPILSATLVSLSKFRMSSIWNNLLVRSSFHTLWFRLGHTHHLVLLRWTEIGAQFQMGGHKHRLANGQHWLEERLLHYVTRDFAKFAQVPCYAVHQHCAGYLASSANLFYVKSTLLFFLKLFVFIFN